jgi:hypothetical protein
MAAPLYSLFSSFTAIDETAEEQNQSDCSAANNPEPDGRGQ